MKNVVLTVSILILFFTSQMYTFAQEKALLLVDLLDQNGQRITNSAVRVRDEKGSLAGEALSSDANSIHISLPPEKPLFLEITSDGFKPYRKQLKLRAGTNPLLVTLEIEDVKGNVIIDSAPADKALEDALSKTWTADEIESLPFDPQSIESQLKNKYGDDIVIKVNGFSGGQLPPREQISSIKVIKSSFDSEFHAPGKTMVDIRTKAGVSKFFGALVFNYNNSRLNAPNAFARKLLPGRNSMAALYLTGPIVEKRTSFNWLVFMKDDYETKNIVAIVPDRKISSSAKTESKTIFTNFGIDYNINKTHTANLAYAFGKSVASNNGVGELVLEEAGFKRAGRFHQVRFFESGILFKKFVNELRVQFIKDDLEMMPNQTSPLTTVPGAFVSGGSAVNNRTKIDSLNFADNVFFDKGKHLIKFGAEFDYEKRRVLSKDGLNGSFIFMSLNDYSNNDPSVYTRREAGNFTTVTSKQFAFYLQDDIRFSGKFQAGLGLRYELQNNPSDRNNFSPRISYAYSPNKDGKIVFRGGAGIFYHWFEAETLSNVLDKSIGRSPDLIVTRQGSRPLLSIRKISPDLVNPSVLVAMSGFNFRVNKSVNVEAFYKFQKGNHLLRSRDINAPINGVRPDSFFGRISQVESSGVFTENSLQVAAEGRLVKGVSFTTRYNLSKAVNNFDGIFDLPVNSYDLNAERGSSNLDVRHRITGNLNFLIFNRLQVTPIFQINSPLPYTIITGRDDNGDTVFNDRPANTKRNSERGDWFRQMDVRLSWRIPLSTRGRSSAGDSVSNEEIIRSLKKSIGFNVTVQNVFNSTNLHGFIGNQLSPFYRGATAAATPRKIEMGINFIF